MRQVQVGDIVYPAFTPVQAGKVTRVRHGTWLTYATFRTLKGKEITTHAFKFYDELVEDHKRKYFKHENILALLRRM